MAVGMPASGKNFAREYAREHGFPFFSTGDVVREECTRRGWEPTGENLARISDELRALDPTEMTRRVLEMVEEKMEADPHHGEWGMVAGNGGAVVPVFLEGMRSWDEIALIRSRFPATVVAFVVGRETRRRRYLSRGRSDDDPRLFDERDMREIGYGIGVPIALADVYILNEGTPDETRRSFSLAVKSVMREDGKREQGERVEKGIRERAESG
ncbi:MAG: AAA family ATPase [Thermoplasmata archaeon]|nr:AAA family ATPase [Thermoplasmata archaeon]